MTNISFFGVPRMIETLLWIDANPGAMKTECVKAQGSGEITIGHRIGELIEAGMVYTADSRKGHGPIYLYTTDRGRRVADAFRTVVRELEVTT